MSLERGERERRILRDHNSDGTAREGDRSYVLTHFFDEWFVATLFPPFLRFCCDRNIHPNILTALALGLSAAIPYFHLNRRTWAVVAAILLRQLLDCLDGEVARRCRKTSNLGAWLDNIADSVFYWALISIVVSFFTRSLPCLIGGASFIFGGLFAAHWIACGGRAIATHALKDYDTRSLYRRVYAYMVNDSLLFAAAIALLYGLAVK
jgi:phosphatidylglycerophosphate synthase